MLNTEIKGRRPNLSLAKYIQVHAHLKLRWKNLGGSNLMLGKTKEWENTAEPTDRLKEQQLTTTQWDIE